MSSESSVQTKILEKEFRYEIPEISKRLKEWNIWKSSRVISVPEISFVGLENEKYKGNVTAVGVYAEKDNNTLLDVNFAVELFCSGSVSGRLPSISSIMSVSTRDYGKVDFSVVGNSKCFANISQDSKTFRAFLNVSSDYLRAQFVVRVLVTLTLCYPYADADWRLAGFSGRCIAARPPYEEVLAKRENTDLTILCGGKEFPADSFILKIVSPVFKSMLESDMKEAASGQIAIADIEPEAIERMVNFIYTGKLFSQEEKPSDDLVIQLLRCADKYDIIDLKKIVLMKVFVQLMVHNSIKYFRALKLYNADEVTLAKVLEFCKSNLSDFQKDADFEQFLMENYRDLI